MKKALGALLVSFSFVAGAMQFAHATPAAPLAGTDYTVLSAVQPVDVPAGKIQVTEFMWVGCPQCDEFDPYLEAWVRQQEPDVVFRRVPVAFRDDFIPHSKMLPALDAMVLADKLTPAVFHEIHVNRNYLLTPDRQAGFLATPGVDRKTDLDKDQSFPVAGDLERATVLMNSYKVNGEPTLAVPGKYVTGPAQTGSLPGVVQVLDCLVLQVREKKL
ncbi:thiol:disulfide interchange protein DsbA/DsbL [Paraburkholderia fungorum]|uniref:Thiol:disulfide interchange protein n=1 Tax=Paraburkholderia fungorum TaxID=134537 RepID=A0A3R7I6B1_9BURK|nr:thiol:disulfide interchange protein DsbA/DsbL [Paraburkholderia fungorum]RKF35720.1 disulfide bond formation protein DsbA [Paraburkholderia fungorum]